MKSIFQFTLHTLLIAAFFSSYVHGQSPMGSYMHIDYINISSNDIPEFKEHVRSTFTPIQNARIQNGDINNWYLYEVTYPGRQNSIYNFVIISTSDRIAGFENIADQIDSAFNDSEKQRLLSAYDRYRITNHSELWKIRNSVQRNGVELPSRYLVMNYMSVRLGMEYEYQMFEDDIARPMHEQRMENNQMDGWGLNELILPGGTEYGYNFSTIDYFEKLEHVEFGFTEELISQTHPDTDLNEFFDNIYRSRDLVRSEVWQLVESVE